MQISFLRTTESNPRKGGIRNETFREQLNIVSIEEIIQQTQLNWFRHEDCRIGAEDVEGN